MQVLGGQYVRGWMRRCMMAPMLLVGSNAQAQDVEVVAPKAITARWTRTKHSVSVTMQADSFSGSNPSIYGTYGLTDNVALAFNFSNRTMISRVGIHDNAP